MADPRLGWTFVPSRTGRGTIGGRTIDYAFDAAGYRVRRADEPVDPERPTILFTGESVMFGKGLTWDEVVPAQVGAMLGMQSANLAVDGYGSDQAFLRLQAELPRFRRPVAVVAMFMTTLFGRNLDDDRPHLGPGLTWLPGVPHGRLRSLAQLVAPYRSDETVERGIAVTREVFAPRWRWPRRAARRRSCSCRSSVPRTASSRRFGAGSSTSRGCRTCSWRSIPPGACRATCTRTRARRAPSPLPSRPG